MVGEKADESIVAVISSLHGIQNAPHTIVYIGDLSIISCFEGARPRIVYLIRPDHPVHERNLLIHMIDESTSCDGIGHAVRVIKPIERDRWCKRRMRSDERKKAEIGSLIRYLQLLNRTVRRPGFHGEVGRKWTHLRHIIHFRSFTHEGFYIIKLRMLPRDPPCKCITRPLLRRTIEFFAVKLNLIADLFIPGTGMKFTDAECPISQVIHRSGQIITATTFHRFRLPGDRFRATITEYPSSRRVTTGTYG